MGKLIVTMWARKSLGGRYSERTKLTLLRSLKFPIDSDKGLDDSNDEEMDAIGDPGEGDNPSEAVLTAALQQRSLSDAVTQAREDEQRGSTTYRKSCKFRPRPHEYFTRLKVGKLILEARIQIQWNRPYISRWFLEGAPERIIIRVLILPQFSFSAKRSRDFEGGG